MKGMQETMCLRRGSVYGRRCRLAMTTGIFLVVQFLTGSAVADSPVADAARRGDLEAVRRLLHSGADVNSPQGDGMTALHWAAEHGAAELGKTLLVAGANVRAGTRIGRYTPLHIAARGGHAAMVKVLLEAGADPQAATTNSGATPLHLAASSGNAEVVTALLERGADANAREGAWGQTPLFFAAAHGRVDAIRALLAAGADPALTSRTIDVVEMEEADKAAERRLTEFVSEFRKKEGGGADWRPAPSQVQAAIEVSRQIQRNWPDVPRPGAEESKRAGKQEVPDEQEKSGEDEVAGRPSVPKPAASQPGPTADIAPVAATFNAEGEPVNPVAKPDDEGQTAPLSYGRLVGAWGGLTPLLHAVRQGHVPAVVALLDGGADVNQPSAGDHTTPLLMAAINGQFDLVLMLLKQGADPNAASDAGTTPLFAVLERTWAPRASYSHPIEHQQQNATHIQVLEALLKAGADPNVRLKKHLWYMEYTFGVLRQSGIELEGATPFWRAAYALDVEAMRLLKAYGADPNVATKKPPERRRRGAPSEEAEKPESKKQVKGKVKEAVNETEPQSTAKAAEGAVAEAVKRPPAANAEGESTEQPGKPEADEEEDHSGVAPVPVGGPAIFPIHAASGVGYGQSFAANAHRHVADNWLAAVKFLVEECGADVNLRDANAYTPLHHAASRGDNELILYLVEKGADVTAVSRKGQTTADMANGPIQRVPPYPSTVALLEKLGSKNNHKCVSC